MTIFEILPDFSSARSMTKYFSTLGVHVIIFLLAFVCLNRLVFTPILKVLRLRKENIDETEMKTREIESKNTILLEEYTWRMDGASQLAAEKREITELIGRCRAEMLLMDVRRETNRDLDNVVKNAETAYAAVAPTVNKDISVYAEEIKSKILSE